VVEQLFLEKIADSGSAEEYFQRFDEEQQKEWREWDNKNEVLWARHRETYMVGQVIDLEGGVVLTESKAVRVFPWNGSKRKFRLANELGCVQFYKTAKSGLKFSTQRNSQHQFACHLILHCWLIPIWPKYM
jgi:hypothetical protein